jgi:hypothetical protein
MTFTITEIAAQQNKTTRTLLAARRRSRIGAAMAAYALVIAAGIAAAGLLVDTRQGAYALVGSGLTGGVLLFALYSFQDRIKAINASVDRALDTLAATRAMVNEYDLPQAQGQALVQNFHALAAARTEDIFGRQRSLLYQSSRASAHRG